MDASGNPVAGDVERALAKKPESVVRAIRDHAYVKVVTEKLDADMLRQFVMTDRAKALAVRLAKIKIPFFGRSIYDSAIRADMTVDDTEFEGPAPFYDPNSRIVKRQLQHHKA